MTKLIFERRISKFVLIILILLIFCQYLSVPSSAGPDQSGVESLDGLINHLYRDTKHVLAAPFHGKQDNRVLFATLSIGAFELMLLDIDFQESVQRNRTISTDRMSDWTDKYTKRVANLTIGGFYLSGILFYNRKSKETALLCLESVALAEGSTICLKHLIGKPRPFANKGAFDFNPLKFPPPSYSQSFSSGHATPAFALSSVIAEQYRNWLVRLVSYSFALAVALGRVNNNIHFLSDVFWGGIIGTTVGRCLVKFHKDDDVRNRELVPMSSADRLGLRILVWLK